MKPNIAFVTGGYSTEAVVSYKSALTIQKNIDTANYNVFRIDITPQGWWYEPANGPKSEVDRKDFSVTDNGKKINFDAVFIGIHGTPGEDGKLQGYFDLLNLPYTSCDAATSAITMNKRYTVAVAAFGGVNVARSMHLFSHTPVSVDTIRNELKLPLFVKPNNGGSSIGMSKVNSWEELQPALDKAFKEDDQILVEEFISGREFTVGVFRTTKEIIVLPITEIITHKEFFDFEAKYEGKSEEVTPAVLTDVQEKAIRETAKRVYEIFNCRGVVRIDMIFDESKSHPYILEINTIPGQTEASVVPQQVRVMGWNLKDFYTALIEDALTRKR